MGFQSTLDRFLSANEPTDGATNDFEVEPWSHTLQTMLMKTPPPEPMRVELDSAELSTFNESPYWPRQGSMSAPSSGPKRQHNAGFNQLDISRQDVLRRQGPDDERRELSETSSDQLALEAIPHGTTICSLLRTVDVSLSQIALELGVSEVDDFIDFSGTRPTLGLEYMSEVSNVEERLKRVVSAWATAIGHEVDVEYLLCHQAKGKDRA